MNARTPTPSAGRVVFARITMTALAATCGLLSLADGNIAFADFVHPGVAHDAGTIAFVTARVEAGQQPWKRAWEAVKSSRSADLSWQPRPRAHVERGPSTH